MKEEAWRIIKTVVFIFSTILALVLLVVFIFSVFHLNRTKSLESGRKNLGETDRQNTLLSFEEDRDNTKDDGSRRFLEETEKPKADFEKMDAWIIRNWEKEGNLQKLRYPNLMNDLYYTLHYELDDSWQWQDIVITEFNPFTGEETVLYEEKSSNGFNFCVIGSKMYIASALEYCENDSDPGITVTEPTKLWVIDLETMEKSLLCDGIYLSVDRMMPLGDGIFLSGLKMGNSHERFDFLGERDWNTVIGYDGSVLIPLKEKIRSGVANALVLGEYLVSDGENTYAGLSRLNPQLENEWSIPSGDYGETVALSDHKLYFTDSTGTQCDVNPIEYLKYADLSTGDIYFTGLDAHYRGLTLLEIPCVLDSMAYAVYSNIPIVDDGDSDWDDYMMCDIYEREAAEKQGFTEEKGYFYYFYRYDLKNDVYIPINEAAVELEK